ncbi:MAG: alanine--glyoxylate aminotransferase family protein [Planctomycetes bacterium]|nr:alanine--glyoxylate aminotransferase family protein [Planctomycetota bacterium]
MAAAQPHRRLFIPGPVEVLPEVLAAMATPMIGHRSAEYAALQGAVRPKLGTLLYTQNRVFLSASSATGLMEGAVRNLCARRVLSCTNGAFSERWHEIALANGKEADALAAEWGKAVRPEQIEEKLKTGRYDVLTLVHNETSTGVMNPLAGIAEVMRRFPEVMFVVDTVSSLAGVKIEVDKLGIDVCLAGVQKAFALPPGLAVCSVSARALERAATVKHRGYYFDFIEMKDYHDKDQTPATPAISQIFALDFQLDRMLKEGLEARWERHLGMARRCRSWAAERGFGLFPEAGYESVTLTTVANTRNVDMKKLEAELAKRGKEISNGYGKLKGKTFRIAHMGDCTPADLDGVLSDIDQILG